MSSFTPGPWRWEFNEEHKSVCLVGGVPQFDKTVMQFERWGMSGAVPAFNDKITGNVWNIMERLCDKPEWLSPHEGREHHANWCADVTHPDARLIAAAPDLLEALEACDEAMDYMSEYDIPITLPDQVKAAIRKAVGDE